MGWFWESKSSGKDAVGQLDPSLKEFLKNETQDKPKAAVEPVPQAAPPSQPVEVEERKVPAASLYQDGRYAHLWKNYRPIEQIEEASKTDSEKLQDIITDYQVRRGNLKAAAQENCADFWLAQNECMRNGSWSSRMTLCRTESKAFNRCIGTQMKFLKALGYANIRGNDQKTLDDIQVHGDTLYRKTLQQEEMVAEAKKEERPVPIFPSVWSTPMREESAANKYPGDRLTEEELLIVKPETRNHYIARIKHAEAMNNKELEVALIRSEIAGGQILGREVGSVMVEEQRNRLAREKSGHATVGDRLKKWWGWN